ncbi:MAG: hypothetical protein ACI959_000557 [Limisphaerales bacterium]|jgi:hypothetical protein
MKKINTYVRVMACALALVLFTQCTEDDLNSPIITLSGYDPVFVALGGSYIEDGASASDIEDGEITTINVDDSELDADKFGVYQILYSAVDAAGNTGSATRTINVFIPIPDFFGVYTTSNEACDDGSGFIYDVTISQSTVDSNTMVYSLNLGDFDPEAVGDITISGDLNAQLSFDFSSGGVDFSGSGNVSTANWNGASSDIVFDLTWTFDDPIDALPAVTCTTTFTKN